MANNLFPENRSQKVDYRNYGMNMKIGSIDLLSDGFTEPCCSYPPLRARR